MSVLSKVEESLTSPLRRLASSSYHLGLASHGDHLRAAQALRFEVFNIELNEGLVHSFDTGLDADAYDPLYDHLIVSESKTGQVVGTYRMQTGTRAAQGLGYYSEREFDFSPFEAMRGEMLELGRACIHRHHRNFAVLNLLWTGIANYARQHGARYLVGCSSLTSLDPAEGMAAYVHLSRRHLAPSAWRTGPHAAFACAPANQGLPAPHIPRLLTAYLKVGACICGAPAMDREFRTIDFLTWLDIESPAVQSLQARGRFVA
jgi:putative hemolysin